MPIANHAANTNSRLMYIGPERFWDDDRHLIEALERSGYSVAISHDQAKALLRLENMTHLPHLVVLVDYDYTWDGVPLVTLIRDSDRLQKIPVLMLSTNCDPHIRNRRPRAMTAGATEFIDIPVAAEDLLDLIRELITP